MPNVVFISARTDELYLERRAAYEAVGVSGALPLVIDPALNKLTDSMVAVRNGGGVVVSPVQQKRFTGRRELRKQVDAILDAADQFVGIYGLTSGAQQHCIAWLTWIEYELYRFLTRQVERSGVPGIKGLLLDVVPLGEHRDRLYRINDLMRSAEYIALLRESLLEGRGRRSSPFSRELHKVMSGRCTLIHKRESGLESRLSYDLQEFLLPIRPYLHEVRTTVLGTPRPGDFHYFPAHARIFELLYEKRPEQPSEDPDALMAHDGLVAIRIRRKPGVPDSSPVLYPLLREVFQAGLDIRLLRIQCLAQGSPSLEEGVFCMAQPIRSGLVEEMELLSSSAILTAQLERELGGPQPGESDYEIMGTATMTMGDVPPIGGSIEALGVLRARHAEDRLHAYSIQALDLPGMLWSVATLIASYGGSIVHMNFDCRVCNQRDANQVSEVTFQVAFLVDETKMELPNGAYPQDEFTQGLRTFEHQLRILHGVVSVSVI